VEKNLILVHVKQLWEEMREEQEKVFFCLWMAHVFSSCYLEDLFLYCFTSIANVFSSELMMFTHLFFFSRSPQMRLLEANVGLSSNLLGTDQALNFLL